ncbi:MAG: hypothetical protein QM784_37525 [Polyangiaceae bacterium]
MRSLDLAMASDARHVPDGLSFDFAFDSPHTESQDAGDGAFALTARQLQQSAKMVQSDPSRMVGSGSAAFLSLDEVSVADAAAAGGASDAALASVAGDDVGLVEPPQADSSGAAAKARGLRLMRQYDTRIEAARPVE